MPRFANLDKLRGFAALSVVLYHVIEITGWSTYPVSGPLVWGRIGWMGVDLFFVISGLVITYSAWTLQARYGERWRREFWRRRWMRIAPLYFFTILVFMCFIQPEWLAAPFKHLGKHLLAHALFIHNLFPATHGSIDGANWSIGVEMQFYLVIALSLPWLVRARTWVVLAVLFAIGLGWRALAFGWIGADDPGRMFHTTTQLPGTLDQFAFGILLCKIMVDQRHAALASWLRRHPLPVMAAAVMLIVVMWLVFWRYSGNYWDNVWMIVFFRPLLGAAAGALILIAMVWPWRVWRWLAAPFDYLGVISYGLYLWHLPVILSLQRTGLPTGVSFLLTTVAGTTLFAAVSWHLFEKRWMQGAHAAAARATVAPSA